MIISIHQPAYIPWLGYFDKIAKSEIHIFLDDAEYSKNNLFNRNKIKTPQGWMWLTVPIYYKSNMQLCDTKISNTSKWTRKHWQSIKTNYSKAEYFKNYSDEIMGFYLREWKKLTDFTISMNKKIAALLGIKTKFVKSSELRALGTRNEKLINLCKAIGADTYLSGQGAKPYMDEKLFLANNIKIRYQDFHQSTYKQLWGEFIPNLSVLDFLFACGTGAFAKTVRSVEE